MSVSDSFTKDNLDLYLKELAKEYRKRGGGVHAELILIGGASVLVNYGFREMTNDIDAICMAPSVMKESINAVGDRFGLPNGWLNTDFMKTSSYTPRLIEHSTYYRTYSHVLEIRTISAEYLIAMKLVSGRRYKKDLSDIVGILYAQKRNGIPITYEKVEKAVLDLYGSWNKVDEYARKVLMKALESSDLENLFVTQARNEEESKNAILEIEEKYPGAVREDNVNEVIKAALAKKQKERKENP